MGAFPNLKTANLVPLRFQGVSAAIGTLAPIEQLLSRARQSVEANARSPHDGDGAMDHLQSLGENGGLQAGPLDVRKNGTPSPSEWRYSHSPWQIPASSTR
jgi:hypothetical protein